MKRKTPEQAIEDMRTIVFRAADQKSTAERECQDCGRKLTLIRGRHSGMWFWSHREMTKCARDKVGMAETFVDEQKAIAATAIWIERKQ